MSTALNMQFLKESLAANSPTFGLELAAKTRKAAGFADVLQLCTLRRRAVAKGVLPKPDTTVRVAFVGGANLRPLVDFIEHFADTLGGIHCEWWTGDYDNYYSEILDTESGLYEFKPE